MINLNFEQFYSELEDVIKNPRPWAHMRYGDGEGIVFGYPQFTSEKKARQRWNKWLGQNNIDMKVHASNIRESIKYADIVGTPCLRHQKVNQDWRNVKTFMHRYNLLRAETKTCCMDCTFELQRHGLYTSLFKHIDSIHYISCRDVSGKLKNVFNFKQVTGIHLPPQHRPNKGKLLTNDKHYPTLYNKIKDMTLNTDLTGQIWLVGAGGLGKVYCMWIKQSGGIALDIGSIFDGWSGLVTRSYLKDIKRFVL